MPATHLGWLRPPLLLVVDLQSEHTHAHSRHTTQTHPHGSAHVGCWRSEHPAGVPLLPASCWLVANCISSQNSCFTTDTHRGWLFCQHCPGPALEFAPPSPQSRTTTWTSRCPWLAPPLLWGQSHRLLFMQYSERGGLAACLPAWCCGGRVALTLLTGAGCCF